MLDHIGPPPRAPLSSAFLLLELYTEECPGNLAIAFHLRNSALASYFPYSTLTRSLLRLNKLKYSDTKYVLVCLRSDPYFILFILHLSYYYLYSIVKGILLIGPKLNLPDYICSRFTYPLSPLSTHRPGEADRLANPADPPR